MNVSHTIPDDIKLFQLAERQHYFCYTRWRLYFSSWLPKGDLRIFIISIPVSDELKPKQSCKHYVKLNLVYLASVGLHVSYMVKLIIKL